MGDMQALLRQEMTNGAEERGRLMEPLKSEMNPNTMQLVTSLMAVHTREINHFQAGYLTSVSY